MDENSIKLNLPCVLNFRDYHEIPRAASIMNEIILNSEVKFKELGCFGTRGFGRYHASFFLEDNEELKKMESEFLKSWKEENDE